MSSIIAWFKLWIVDWSNVSEVVLGAILAFIFGFFLQWWMVRRQERFQKALLERQLSFLERLETERSDRDAKAEERRLANDQAIAGRYNAIRQKIAMDDRNHESKQRSEDRYQARKREL